MTTEWGTGGSRIGTSALDEMNMRRVMDKLTRRMLAVISGLPRRSDRHTGYRLRRRVERDAMFRLVNEVTDLNVQTKSVHRHVRGALIVKMSSTMGEITFTGWDERG